MQACAMSGNPKCVHVWQRDQTVLMSAELRLCVKGFRGCQHAADRQRGHCCWASPTCKLFIHEAPPEAVQQNPQRVPPAARCDTLAMLQGLRRDPCVVSAGLVHQCSNAISTQRMQRVGSFGLKCRPTPAWSGMAAYLFLGVTKAELTSTSCCMPASFAAAATLATP